MAKQPVDEMSERDAPTTGQLEVPAEPETSAQSLAEAIMADFQAEPVKKKPGRPKKQVAEEVDPDDDSLPPEHLMPTAEEATEQDTEPTDGDDDTDEPTDLEEQLTALAQESGVEPELLEGMSIPEAERFVDRYYKAFYRDGQRYEFPQNGNGHAASGHAEAIPAARENGAVQTPKSLDINLDDFDDDEPVKPVLKKLVEHNAALAKKLEQLEYADVGRQQAEFERAQRQAAVEFQQELFRLSPELFGTMKQQSPRQVRQATAVFEAADTLIRGCAARGAKLPSIGRLAKWATQAEFADELANTKLLARQTSVAQRAKKRLGAPAKNSRGSTSSSSAKAYEGPMENDPDILAAVRSTLSRTRD